jgi:uncharacterized phage-like protein YoqJ
MRSFVVAFTGHRSYSHQACTALQECVARLYAEGARTFRVGMAEGFDLAAGEAVISLMAQHDDVALEAYIPYPNFASNFSVVDAQRYNQIIARCRRVTYAAEVYHTSVFRLRNDMLVDGAQVVVAWWNGRASGTGYTVGKGRSRRCRIVNLFGGSQCELEF